MTVDLFVCQNSSITPLRVAVRTSFDIFVKVSIFSSEDLTLLRVYVLINGFKSLSLLEAISMFPSIPLKIIPLKQISISLLCSSLIVGLSPALFAGGPPPQRRGKPVEAEPAESHPSTPHPTTTSETPTQSQPAQFPLPSGRVSPVNGLVTLKLVNHTNAVINYQVVGGTRERVLGEQSQTELIGFPIPLTLTYQRQDSGLLIVLTKSTAPGVLEVRFQGTNNFDLDTKSLNIPKSGSVFLN